MLSKTPPQVVPSSISAHAHSTSLRSDWKRQGAKTQVSTPGCLSFASLRLCVFAFLFFRCKWGMLSKTPPQFLASFLPAFPLTPTQHRFDRIGNATAQVPTPGFHSFASLRLCVPILPLQMGHVEQNAAAIPCFLPSFQHFRSRPLNIALIGLETPRRKFQRRDFIPLRLCVLSSLRSYSSAADGAC